MKNLDLVLTNIEKFKQTNALTKAYNNNGCIFEPLKYKNNNYGFMLVSEEKYETAVDELGTYQQKHRYYYYEKFNDGNNNVVIIMFNPSKANPFKDDPTIKICRKIVEEKYDSMEIINIFSERNPKVNKIDARNNSENMGFIGKFLNNRETVDVILAWGYGKEKKYKKEIDEVVNLLNKNNKYIISLNENTINSIQARGLHPYSTNYFEGYKAVKLSKLD